jgi:hypothetical protein
MSSLRPLWLVWLAAVVLKNLLDKISDKYRNLAQSSDSYGRLEPSMKHTVTLVALFIQ